MAFICGVELNSGINVDDAYHIISSFSGTATSLNFNVSVYVDKSAYENGKQAITSRTYDMDFDKDKNLFRQMHEYMSGLPEYENAVEA